MPARIQNNPAYSVYDLSHKQSVSYTATANGVSGGTITGTLQNIIDKNLTTSYEVKITGAAPTAVEIVIDYGTIYWNCQLYTDLFLEAAAGVTTHNLSYSTDGINWTDLETTNITDNTIKSYQIMAIRYLSLGCTSNSGALCTAKIYECRLMGS